MVAGERKQDQQQEGVVLTPPATDASTSGSRAGTSLRKLVLDDFLEVIGGGDAQTQQAAKEYQQTLAANRRKAAASRSNTYRPGANMPDVAWKPPHQESVNGGEAEEAGPANDHGASDAEEALRAMLNGTEGEKREDVLAGE